MRGDLRRAGALSGQQGQRPAQLSVHKRVLRRGKAQGQRGPGGGRGDSLDQPPDLPGLRGQADRDPRRGEPGGPGRVPAHLRAPNRFGGRGPGGPLPDPGGLPGGQRREPQLPGGGPDPLQKRQAPCGRHPPVGRRLPGVGSPGGGGADPGGRGGGGVLPLPAGGGGRPGNHERLPELFPNHRLQRRRGRVPVLAAGLPRGVFHSAQGGRHGGEHQRVCHRKADGAGPALQAL